MVARECELRHGLHKNACLLGAPNFVTDQAKADVLTVVECFYHKAGKTSGWVINT